jgi:N-acetylneuraminate lyase
LEAARPAGLETIVQVGDNCQENARRMAAHARQIGADAIAAHAPSYFRPADVASLVEFLVPIAAEASELPFYFYDIPATTRVTLPMVPFLELAQARIPNLAGLKYSNTDLVQLQECLRVKGGAYQILFGCDEFLLAGLVLGVHGAIGSTYNYAAPLYRRMVAALQAGDLNAARRCQNQSVDLVRLLSRFGFLAASKYASTLVGIDCGPVRAPLRNLSAGECEQLREGLERLGLREIVAPNR